MPNKTYCPMPFMHIYNGSDGSYDLCCHTRPHTDTSRKLRKRTVNDTLPFEHFMSKEMDDIRKKFLNGEKVDACHDCYELEKYNGRSKRIEYINRHGKPTEPDRLVLKLRIFGNYCNLSCYMCHPFNSTTRTNELIRIGETGSNWRFEDNMKFTKVSFEQVEKNILDNIHKVDWLQITGGEPLQSLRMYRFLEKIPKEYSNIKIGFTSNMTKTTWKNKSFDDILEKFSDVKVKVSCDHWDEKLAYIRWPIDVDEFYDNVFKYKNICKISPTISVLNVADLDDITDFYTKEFDIETFYETASIVNYPICLTPANHYDRVKIVEKYKNREEYQHAYAYMTNERWLKNRDANRQHMFKYLDKLTPTRGDWRNLWNVI